MPDFDPFGEGRPRSPLDYSTKMLAGKGKTIPYSDRLSIAREALWLSLNQHTEQTTYIPEGDVLRTAMQISRGKIGYAELKNSYLQAIKKGDIIFQLNDGSGPNLLTSRIALEKEKGNEMSLPTLIPIEKSPLCVKKKERDSSLRLSDVIKKLQRNHQEIEDSELRCESIAEEFILEKTKKDTLILAGSHQMGKDLTMSVREAMNILGEGLAYPIFSVEDWSVKELKSIYRYSLG